MEKNKRRYFPDEFKRRAAERVETSGLSIMDVGAELGVHETQLRRWIRQFGKSPADLVTENARLKRELQKAQTERDILKKPRSPALSDRRRSQAHSGEIAAGVNAQMPWMAPATEVAWHAMRRCAQDGTPVFRLPPMLLIGPPGIGKSHWARALGDALRVPTTVIDAATEAASFSVAGVQRGWGSAAPGKPVDTILNRRILNPIVVVDEIDKAGDVRATSGTRYSLTEALLSLLEPATAARWSCPFYRVPFDMSRIGWVMTANSPQGLPDPLLSRCPPLILRAVQRRLDRAERLERRPVLN